MEDSAGAVAVTLGTDGRGRKVSVIDWSVIVGHAGPKAAATAGQTMWACWHAGGTLEDPQRAGEAIRGAGDLCMWWLEQSSIAWDRGRWRALVPRLNAYRLSGYVDEEVTPWVWIRDNVLPLVPISIHSGKDGIYPVWWRYDAKRSECLETIRVMPGISLVGSVRYDRKPRDIVSEIRLKWAMDGATSDYRRTSVLEDQRDAADPESQSSAHARTSAHRASDARRVEVLESDLVWDEPTAALVLAARLAAVGWSPRTVTYSLPAEFAWLDLGDPVILIDPELYIDSVALIYGWALTDDGQVVLDLMLCGDPALATATTGPNPTGDDYDPDDPNQMPM
jgi:hypothetical protein